MHLKEHQWYQLPSGQWGKAILVDDPLGPIVQVYGTDLASSAGYTTTFDIYVEHDGTTLDVTGLCTWDTWTLADLREATPDEAEAQTYRVLHLPARLTPAAPTIDEEPMPIPPTPEATRPTLTVRVLPCLDNHPTVTYDVFVVGHPAFAAGGDDATTAVLDAVQHILAREY